MNRVAESSEIDAYAQVAQLYEHEYGGLEVDVAYFDRNGTTGPLLVLGCGTGRLGRTLSSHRSVVGLDRSEAMLDIARARAPEVSYVHGDMRDFSLGTFSEIVMPNGAFNFLSTRADQIRCLEACARALTRGGCLTIDMPMPAFEFLGTRHSDEKAAWSGFFQGQEARRTREVLRSPVAQRLELIDRYYLDGVLVHTSTLRLRLVFPAEIEWILESAGFVVEAMHGNYQGEDLREGCPRLIARALLA